MKAVIGVVPLFDEAKDSIWMLPVALENYINKILVDSQNILCYPL